MPKSSPTVIVGLLSIVSVFCDASAQTSSPMSGGGAYRVGGGVTAPKAISAPDPEYSADARLAAYECTSVLYLVLSPQGVPRDIRVARSCDLGLDEEAIVAVRKWKFEPSTKDGVPVAVQINVEVTFHLYDKPDTKTLIKRANKGDTTAQLQLSNMYFHGEPGLPQDFDLGKEWQQKAASSGQRLAQYLLARRLEDQDPAGAYMWYNLAREQGYDPASAKLADLSTKMSPEQLAEAQARIEEWEKTHR